jgi:U3 small nucleolar RNA-associated protein 18
MPMNDDSRGFYEDYGYKEYAAETGANSERGKRASRFNVTESLFQSESTLERVVFGGRRQRRGAPLSNHLSSKDQYVQESELETAPSSEGSNSREHELDHWSGSAATPAPSSIRARPESATDSESEYVSLEERDRRRKLRHFVDEIVVSRRTFEQRLREQFVALHGIPRWAARHDNTARADNGTVAVSLVSDTGNDALDPEGPVAASAASSRGASATRPPLHWKALTIRRLTDANAAAPAASVLTSVRFHPASAHLCFTAGFDKRLRLFHLTEEPADNLRWKGVRENECLHTVCFADMPIYTAEFVRGSHGAITNSVLLTGRRRFFYEYDLAAQKGIKIRTLESLRKERSFERFTVSPDGKLLAFTGDDSQVILVDAVTKQYLGCVRIACGPQSGAALPRVVTFAPDGLMIAVAGETSGYVSLYDLRMCFTDSGMNASQPLARFLDEGTVRCTALKWSPTGQYLATGSDAGIVNIYDGRAIRGQASTKASGESVTPRERNMHPLASVSNLVTQIDTFAFLPDDQALFYASQAKRNAARVYHLASRKTFPNWPTSQTPLHRVWSASFSPGGGFLALGNDRGRALLYRLRCYAPT